jgi:non-specific serine/threonine protein kinase
MRGDAVDGRERVDAVRALDESSSPSRGMAAALGGASVLARQLGDFQTAQTLGEKALTVARQLDDRLRIAAVTFSLGRLASLQGRYAESGDLLNESKELFAQLGQTAGIAANLNRLGYLAFAQGDVAGAWKLLKQSLAVARLTGHRRLVGTALFNLGLTAHFGGDVAAACRLYEEFRTITSALGDRHDLAMALHLLGHATVMQGDVTAARAHYRDSLILARELGDRRRMALILWAVAGLAAAEHEAERAVRLHAIAWASIETMGHVPARPIRELWNAQVAPAWRALSEPSVDAAAAAGRGLTIEQASDETVAWLETTLTQASPKVAQAESRQRRASARRTTGGSCDPRGAELDQEHQRSRIRSLRSALSPREYEVASLVASGCSNREIANMLVIAERTAENHVANIRGKLGFKSRSQVAAWAVQHGLLDREGRDAVQSR